MFDRNLLTLPGARQLLACLAVFAMVDAALIVVQALCLAQALTAVWEASPFPGPAAFALIVGGSLLPEANLLALAALCVAGFFAAFLLRQTLVVVRDRMVDRFSQKTCAELRKQLAEAAFDLGPLHVSATGSAAAATQLAEGVDAVGTYIRLVLPKVTELMVVPVLLIVALFVLDWISGLIALVLLPCIILFMQMLGSHAKAQAAAQKASYDRLSNHFMDTLRGLTTLKAFGRSQAYDAQVFTASEHARESALATQKTAFLNSLVLDLFRTFGLAAVAIMFGFRLMDGSMALLPALAVLIILPEYFAVIKRFASDFHAGLDGRTNLAGMLATLSEAQTLRGRRAAYPDIAVPAWDKTSTLSALDLGFSYGERGEDEAPAGEDVENGANCPDHASALSHLNFTIEGAKKVGIVGPSGSGKTTLVRLLAGFADAPSGAFAVNGHETPTLATPDWLRQTLYIPQNPTIMSANLRDNIAFYVPDAPDSAVLAAAQLAGLTPVLEELPQGLDTLIGPGGRTLSGGEAQRVALARAFLDDSRRILIFDEPTAHLDIETELALKPAMLAAMEGRLVFFATHRLHWLTDMDTVLELRDGRLTSQGEEVHHG